MNNIQVPIVIKVADPGRRKDILKVSRLIDGANGMLLEIQSDKPVFHLGRRLSGITQGTIGFINANNGLIVPVPIQIIHHRGGKTRSSDRPSLNAISILSS